MVSKAHYKAYQKEYRRTHKEEIRKQRNGYYNKNNIEIREKKLCYYWQIKRPLLNITRPVFAWQPYEDDILKKYCGKIFTREIHNKYLPSRQERMITKRCRFLRLSCKIPPRKDLAKLNKFYKGMSWEERYGEEKALALKLNHIKNHSGKNCIFYKNGKGKEPYPVGWGKFVNKQIRKRDQVCQICSTSNKENKKKYGWELDVHHIDRNKKNLDEFNLICLCRCCHGKIQLIQNDLQDHFHAKLLGVL